jgi:hypothetical protein
MPEEKASTPYSTVLGGLTAVVGRFGHWAAHAATDESRELGALGAPERRRGAPVGRERARVGELQETETGGQLALAALGALDDFRRELRGWVDAGGSDPRGAALLSLLDAIRSSASHPFAARFLESARGVIERTERRP